MFNFCAPPRPTYTAYTFVNDLHPHPNRRTRTHLDTEIPAPMPDNMHCIHCVTQLGPKLAETKAALGPVHLIRWLALLGMHTHIALCVFVCVCLFAKLVGNRIFAQLVALC